MEQLYICQFCNMIGTKKDIFEHEKICSRNPDLKMCDSCSNRVYLEGVVTNTCKLNKISFIIGNETCSKWRSR